jgi:hypothetical protein
MTDCKFVTSEVTQEILHEYCQNPEMLKINKPKDGKQLNCIGPAKCRCSIKKDSENE